MPDVIKKYRYFLFLVAGIIIPGLIISIIISCERFDYERVIIIETGEATRITPISAEINGEILDPGESTITQYGHCWSKNENPTIELSTKTHTNGAIGRGSYKSTLTDLASETRYFVRAYATNSQGTVYSVQDEFFTARGKPVAEFYALPLEIMEGDSVEFVDQSSNMPDDWHWDFGDNSFSGSQIPVHTYSQAGIYTVSLTAINSYGSDTKTRADYIRVNPNQRAPVPEFTVSKTTVLVGESVQFTDFSANNPTSWFWNFGDGVTSTDQNPSHIYLAVGLYPVTLTARNSYGVNTIIKNGLITVIESIVETGIYTDSRDAHEYKWVKIGEQVWMAENLAYLPDVYPPTDYSTVDPAKYVYEYYGINPEEAKISVNYSTYGVLYNWPAAMSGAVSSDGNPSGVKGICPDGWHLPSDAEWDDLICYVGKNCSDLFNSYAGGKLKEDGLSHWVDPNTGATNTTGFTGLPGGSCGNDRDEGIFDGLGYEAYFWSSVEDVDGAIFWNLTTGDAQVHRDYSRKSHGKSVRCVKDGGSVKKQLRVTVDDIPVIPQQIR